MFESVLCDLAFHGVDDAGVVDFVTAAAPGPNAPSPPAVGADAGVF